jgi:putative transposase
VREKRQFTQGSYFHVTSRTNDKIRVFENNLGRKIILITLQDAKDKFHFQLIKFCIMPTHIHLLIKPDDKTKLSVIMHWIKNIAANAGILYTAQKITFGPTAF